MGQLLNRLWNFAKSEANTSGSVNEISIDDSAELKRLIDELNSSKNQSKHEERKQTSTQSELMNESLAYSVLNIKNTATVDEIKQSYKDRIKEYHPDRVATLGSEIKILAEKKTKQINEAYLFLRKLKGF